jgi:hypothetical protein
LPSIYLALDWKLFGYSPLVTRLAVLAVASLGLTAVWRLALRLTNIPSVALWTMALTALYPVWFAQSSLAHADIFAAACALWGLVYVLPARADHTHQSPKPFAAALCFAAAALCKETAIVIPLTLAAISLAESLHTPGPSRLCLRRQAAWLASCALPLAAWYAFHYIETGFLFGNPEFLRYNAQANLSLLRILAAFGYRILHLTAHMNLFVPVGLAIAALLLPPRSDREQGSEIRDQETENKSDSPTICHLEQDEYAGHAENNQKSCHPEQDKKACHPERSLSRSLRQTQSKDLRLLLSLTCPTIAPPTLRRIVLLLLANALFFSILGGALLTRYLLPMYPLVLLLAVNTLRRRAPYWQALVLLSAAAFILALFVNPPYRFAPEDNLAYARVIRLHQAGIHQLEARYPGATVLTAWPVSDELTRPELGYLKQPSAPTFEIFRIEDFTAAEIARAAQQPERYSAALVFSTKYDPPAQPLSFGPMNFGNWSLGSLHFGYWNDAVNERYFGLHHDLLPAEIARQLHGDLVWEEQDHGQWIALLRFNRQFDARLDSEHN